MPKKYPFWYKEFHVRELLVAWKNRKKQPSEFDIYRKYMARIRGVSSNSRLQRVSSSATYALRDFYDGSR